MPIHVKAASARRADAGLNLGDPAELPESMRSPMPNSVADGAALLPWRRGSAQIREALVYGSYIAQSWRLADCSTTVDQVQRAAADLIGHSGVALVSGYRKPILWMLLEVEIIAGDFLPARSVGIRPRNVRLAFAAKCCLPSGVVVGRDIRAATKCYAGCRKLSGDLGILEIGAEERRARRADWRERIDVIRALRALRARPQFYFAPTSPESS